MSPSDIPGAGVKSLQRRAARIVVCEPCHEGDHAKCIGWKSDFRSYDFTCECPEHDEPEPDA